MENDNRKTETVITSPPATGSVTVVEMSGNETDEQCKDIAWQMMCNAHPVEAHSYDPDRFWKFFHARAPHMTREQMVALLKECEEPESESPNAKLTHSRGRQWWSAKTNMNEPTTSNVESAPAVAVQRVVSTRQQHKKYE